MLTWDLFGFRWMTVVGVAWCSSLRRNIRILFAKFTIRFLASNPVILLQDSLANCSDTPYRQKPRKSTSVKDGLEILLPTCDSSAWNRSRGAGNLPINQAQPAHSGAQHPEPQTRIDTGARTEIQEMAAQIPQSFQRKKAKILSQLAIPDAQYDDLSPKGSVDVQIRQLIDEINAVEGLVTTSSCAGRVSVFLEGKRRHGGEESGNGDPEREDVQERAKVTSAGTGGKGGGGRWLYVSHDPVVVEDMAGDATAFLGLRRREAPFDVVELAGRRVHFKYEGFILHVLTSSLANAQIVLQAGMQAGFRESGALNLISTTGEAPTPMVAVRSQGLSLESIIGCAIGGQEVCTVPEANLRDLVNLANERFEENTRRIGRFTSLLKEGMERGEGGVKRGKDGEVWEDVHARRERKKAEGLKLREEVRRQKEELARENSEVFTEGS